MAQGLRLARAATDLRHDLTGLEPPALANGWQLIAGGWDAFQEESLTAAYAGGHPDGSPGAAASDEPCSPTHCKAPTAPATPTLELSVVDGGPGRRLYDTAGFAVITRVLSIPPLGTAYP